MFIFLKNDLTSILGVFTRVITKLQKLQESHTNKIQMKNQEIAEITESRAVLEYEINRASAVLRNLQTFVGTE